MGLEDSVAAVPAVAVLVYELEEAVVVTDSEEAVEGRGGFSGKMKRDIPPPETGLMTVGDSFERKSR